MDKAAKRKPVGVVEYMLSRIANDPERVARVRKRAREHILANQIIKLRKERGLTQVQLAKRAKTSQSAISRIESANYHGHSLKMLDRIARALDGRVEVAILPEEAFELEPGERGPVAKKKPAAKKRRAGKKKAAAKRR